MDNGKPSIIGGSEARSVWHSFLVRLLLIGMLQTVGLPTLAPAADRLLTSGRFNELQLIASHNSFKQAMDPPLLEVMRTLSNQAEGLDYSHVSLTDQLDFGLRGLEIDILNDPNGGLYANPLGLQMLKQLDAEALPYDKQAMLNPGFKVMHVPDFDFRSSQPTLAGTLAELREWSSANPRHLPIFISSNLTDTAAPAPGTVQPAPFDLRALGKVMPRTRQQPQVRVQQLPQRRQMVPPRGKGSERSLGLLEIGWLSSMPRKRARNSCDREQPVDYAASCADADLRGWQLRASPAAGRLARALP